MVKVPVRISGMLVAALALVPAQGVTGTLGAAHSATTASRRPVIVFGTTGGYGAPFSVAIDGDGKVEVPKRTSSGHVRWVTRPRRQWLARPAVQGLLRLARVTGFFSMPASIVDQRLRGAIDVPTLYIRISEDRRTKRVDVYGRGTDGFYQLWHLMNAASGFPSNPE